MATELSARCFTAQLVSKPKPPESPKGLDADSLAQTIERLLVKDVLRGGSDVLQLSIKAFACVHVLIRLAFYMISRTAFCIIP